MPLAFPHQDLIAARERITRTGQSISEWSRQNDLDVQLTGHVLRGSLRATRGESYRIAVALGLRSAAPKKRARTATVSQPTP